MENCFLLADFKHSQPRLLAVFVGVPLKTTQENCSRNTTTNTVKMQATNQKTTRMMQILRISGDT